MYRVGIDLGGTNIVAAVVNDDYELVSTAKCKTAMPRPAEAIVADIAKMARLAAERAGLTLSDIAHIGIGSPGACNSVTGVVEFAGNLDFNNVPLCDMLSALLDGKKVLLENDANAAALGEYLAGAGRDVDSIVCVTLGTGVGGGVVDHGRVLRGHNFMAAELGHSVMVLDGEPCTCGRRGCFEAYASASALVRQTKEAMKAHPESKMWELAGGCLDNVNGLTSFDAMRAGDPAGRQVVDTYIHYLACGLTNMINIFQPEVMCIGGGICNEGDTLTVPLMKEIAEKRFNPRGPVQGQLRTAQLGNNAGVIGAAFLGDLEN